MDIAVIVANPCDVHAHAVRTAVRRLGGDARVLDVQEFTRSFDLTTRLGVGQRSAEISPHGSDEARFRLQDISGLWWRRIAYPPTENREHNGGNVFSVSRTERRAALLGSVSAVVSNAFNDLERSRHADSKPLQLAMAQRLGLRIPETLITNDPDEVRSFYANSTGRTVYKMFKGAPDGLYVTRLLEERELSLLYRLPACPAIFQEYIEGEYDVRAVVVGSEVFAAKIEYQPLKDVIDTRFVATKITPMSLPSPLTTRLVQLVSDFGLVYSSIDLRYSTSSEYVFFESNPEGQYLWLEIEADLPISECIARRLLGEMPRPTVSRVGERMVEMDRTAIRESGMAGS